MFCLRRHLVRRQLRHELATPCIVILRVVDDAAALLSVMDDGMEDVRAGLALVDALDLVAFEFAFQQLEEVDLRTLPEFFGGLVIHAR